MAVYNYDVVVLGSGPAGEGAAMNAAKAGRKVAMVDSRRQVGGNCTHLGTIPSKALRHSVRQIMQFNTNPMFRAIGEPRWFCLLYTSPSPRDRTRSRMPSSA